MIPKYKKYRQGIFTPKHPEKYIGNVNNIVYRSGLELKYFKWLDNNPSIINWASEEISIKYISDLDHEQHRYFPDLIIKYKSKDGIIKTIIAEIKPSIYTKCPKRGKKTAKSYQALLLEFIKNQNKWNAAQKFCDTNGFKFYIFTEKDLEKKRGGLK